MERKGGREGELECSAPREHAALDGVVVHLCVFVCVSVCVHVRGECVELPWPWLGAPLSKVFVVELTRVGSFVVGTRHPVPALRAPQHEQGLLNLPFSAPLRLFFYSYN